MNEAAILVQLSPGYFQIEHARQRGRWTLAPDHVCWLSDLLPAQTPLSVAQEIALQHGLILAKCA
jgi:hypothetical protein